MICYIMSKKFTHNNMIESIITSQTRIRLILKFFLNPDVKSYLRQLAKDFDESTNAIRLELNKLSEAKILLSKPEGRNKVYQANREHPLFNDIRNIVLKSTGVDQVIQNILNKLGKLQLAFIRGDYASGKDSGLIDLVLVGDELNMEEIERVRTKTEKLINRKISVLVLTKSEYKKLYSNFKNGPKIILLENENT
jgi:hypothetical protein